ncbi:hypothetical protein B0H14DRAFT_2772663 [Mycena olivaceomarginata]|nr:hypothetical protein B0H14DRAFT_2772663 [Mycena olivaceomarginata]
MFERKNQNVLSAHYSKLIEGDGDDDDEEEFITLKRADHELDGGEVGVDEAADMSKRKQWLMASKAKRALLTGGLGKKLIFDEEKPHEMYEMEDADAWINDKGRMREGEKGRMQEANVRDKEEAKEKKREKKRKRKEREKAEAGVMGGSPMVADADDDGYVEPEFDLPTSDSDDDREVWAPPPPTKRSKTTHTDTGPRAVEDDEELALRPGRHEVLSTCPVRLRASWYSSMSVYFLFL